MSSGASNPSCASTCTARASSVQSAGELVDGGDTRLGSAQQRNTGRYTEQVGDRLVGCDLNGLPQRTDGAQAEDGPCGGVELAGHQPKQR